MSESKVGYADVSNIFNHQAIKGLRSDSGPVFTPSLC